MRVLVTGGNGFIGSVVVRRLIDSGHSVRCLLRKNSNTSRIADLRFERAIGDVRDAASLHSAFHGCTHVVHLAGIVNWKDVRSKEMDDVVVGGTRNVLAAAKAADCRRVVYVSSILAICSSVKPQIFDETSRPDPEMLKLAASNTKIGAEQLCREAVASGLDVVVVNPGEVYGPEDSSLTTAGNLVDFAKSSPVFVCSGGTSIIHVEDAAIGILAALEKGRKGERYILGGENLTVRELAELTLKILNRNKRIVQLPNVLLRLLAWTGIHLRLPLPFNPEVIPYATRYWFMDNLRARQELNVTFRGAQETLKPTLRWLQNNGYLEEFNGGIARTANAR
jgi:dihydroflavonol-4-reductase